MSALAILRQAWSRLAGTLAPSSARMRADEELREELESHFEMHIAENMRRGMSADEARREALLAAGGLTAAAEAVRERRGLPAIEGLVQDVRYAVRGLVTRPGYVLAIVLALAIGIGANTAIFSVVDAVVLHPLPYPEPDRIVSLSETVDGNDIGSVDEVTYRAWARSARTMTMAAYVPNFGVLALRAGPEQVRGSEIALDYFSILGLRPLVGRSLTQADFDRGAPNAMLLSDQLWRRAFGGDAAVLGRTIDVDDRPTTVIGVMPAEASSETGPQYWVPFRREPSPAGVVYYWSLIGRLRPGATIAQARAELATLMATVPPMPGRKTTISPVVMTLAQRLYGEQRKPVLLLFGAVVVLLLIACANVANLTLVRAAGRQRELAVRLALGAGRRRLARLFLCESLLLGLVGGAFGLLLAHALTAYLVHLSPASVGNPERIRLDGAVLSFTTAIAVVSALLFGIAPVLVTGRGDLARALSTGTPRASASSKQHAIRRFLVVAQLATALVLLTGAALVARSFYRVTSIDLGFRPDGLVSVSINLPRSKYPDSRVGPYVDELLVRVRRLPGVESAALGIAPLSGMSGKYSTHDSAGHDTPPLDEIQAGRGYFQTIGARMLAGRSFTSTDNAHSPLVVVVNKALAQRLYPSVDAVGRTMAGPGGKATIIGVVANIRPQLEAQAPPVVYPSLEQMGIGNYEFLLVRASQAPGPVEDAIKRIMHDMDPSLAPPQIHALDDVVAHAVAPRKFVFVLLALFAGVAASLAVIGLYGVLSRVVAERTREIGIRIALGAQPRGVIATVLGQAFTLVAIGSALGIAGSLAAARVMRSLVYETSVHDPYAFAGATMLLVSVAVLASYLPARRATTVDPVMALRHE